MSSLVRRIENRLVAKLPDDPEERAEALAIMRKDRQGRRRGKARGRRRTTNQRGQKVAPRSPLLTPPSRCRHPRPIRGRNPATGRKLGGAKAKPSPAIRPTWRPRSKNSDPAYRKSIWPAGKLARE